MANVGLMSEGNSTTRPPLFNGNNYGYWKARMTIFLQSMDYELCDVIEKGPYIPMKKCEESLVEKLKSEWDDTDKKRISINARAMNTLFCALSMEEFNRIQSCKTT